jgi:hypothetical protein
MTDTKPLAVTINAEQRLFVIPSGSGYSCWGFDNCYRETKALAERLGRPLPLESEIGTMKQYHENRDLIHYVTRNKIDLGTWHTPGTPVIVQTIIDDCLKTGRKVRLYYGDKDTGRDWMNEHDMIGRIGRSTGIMKIPLLVPDRDDGGPGLLEDCIIRIQDYKTQQDLWAQSNYHVPEMKVVPAVSKGYREAVEVGGEIHAQFKEFHKAERWIAFMKGERMMS